MRSSIVQPVGTHLGVFDFLGRIGASFFVLVVEREPASDGAGVALLWAEVLDADVVDAGSLYGLIVAHNANEAPLGDRARVGALGSDTGRGVSTPRSTATVLGSEVPPLGAGVWVMGAVGMSQGVSPLPVGLG
jgi:hypothetical protein